MLINIMCSLCLVYAISSLNAIVIIFKTLKDMLYLTIIYKPDIFASNKGAHDVVLHRYIRSKQLLHESTLLAKEISVSCAIYHVLLLYCCYHYYYYYC